MTITPSTELNDDIARHADGLICRLLDAVSSLDDTDTEEGRTVALTNLRESVLLARKVQVASNNLSFIMCASAAPAPAPPEAPTSEKAMADRVENALEMVLREMYPRVVGAYTHLVSARGNYGDELALRSCQRDLFAAMDVLQCVHDELADGNRSVAKDDGAELEQGGVRG